MPNEITLYGSVGGCWWDEEFFTAATVRDQLAGMTGPLTVKINSGGGSPTEGQAIYNLLRDYAGEVTVEIVSMAASAASLIAMAGDRIVMRMGALLMIHDPAQPWTEGRGTEEDHRKLADQLAVIADAYAEVYAARAGITTAEARTIMREEVFMDGAMAMEKGFADARDGAAEALPAAKFDYRLYAQAPAALRAASEVLGQRPGQGPKVGMIAGKPRPNLEMTMVETTVAAGQLTPAAETLAPAAAPVAQPGVEMQRGVEAERSRVRMITGMVETARLPMSMATDLIAKGVTVEEAQTQIQAAWKKEGGVDTGVQGRETAKVTMDARDKFIAGAGLALQMKARVKGGERNEFSSMTLAELARHSLVMAGERAVFTDRRDMVGRALTMSGGMHTTSDFANILSNVAGKAALMGWESATETFELWTRKGTLTDYKPAKRVGTGLVPSLREVKEGADYKYITVGDRAETLALVTYGELLRISRQAIINDDLDMLGNMPMKLGRAAKRTIGDLVYAILTGNPTMADGTALFHADHANLLTGGGSALAVAGLSAARAAMRIQKESATGPALNITPKYLIVPAALETAANQLINSTVDPTANKGHASNPVGGMAQVVVDGRLDAASTSAWYLAADADAYDTIEVAYLDGNDVPFIDQETEWTSDGVSLKVRIDAVAGPLDSRTLQKNAGA